MKTNNKMMLEDITVIDSALRNVNNVGKATWWGVNAIGSLSKVLTVTVANSDVKAIRVIDDNDYSFVGSHGSNSGFAAIDYVSEHIGSVFGSTDKKEPKKSTGYSGFGNK